MKDTIDKMLKRANADIAAGEAIIVSSCIPKFDGILARDWLQYAIVDSKLKSVAILPSFLRSMEDVTRYIKAAEIIHAEAVELSQSISN